MTREPHDDLVFIGFIFLAAVALLAILLFAFTTMRGNEQRDRFGDIPQSPGNFAVWAR